MMFLNKILLRIYILSILPIAVTSTNSSQTGLVVLPISEIPVTNSDSIANPSVDLDNAIQCVERTKKIPESKTEKRKHNPDIDSESQSSEPPSKRQNIQENAAEYLGEFRHELLPTFLLTEFFFDYKSYYDILLAYSNTVFIEKFCSNDQLQDINLNLCLKLDKSAENIFEILEAYTKRIVSRYVEIYGTFEKNYPSRKIRMYDSINKALDPARTKGFYYLLIYSFYETGLIGIPRCMAAVEKIFINIITYVRLMAYMHNDKVKEEMKSRKRRSSKKSTSRMSKSERTKYYRSNFSYTDFTKALKGAHFKKYDLFHKNADLLRKEINDNIQLIIDKEFGDNPRYKKMCEDYNSKALEFNKSILFKRFPFIISKNINLKYLAGAVTGYNLFLYNFGYPKNILSRLMDTDTKKQIKELADIKLKSVFILIFISKICLCNVTDLCTLPEYLILIGSLQEAYHEHKPGQDTIANFQSLLSYFFSLHYLERSQEIIAQRRERALNVVEEVFPEYREIFPYFSSAIYNLKDDTRAHQNLFAKNPK